MMCEHFNIVSREKHVYVCYAHNGHAQGTKGRPGALKGSKSLFGQFDIFSGWKFFHSYSVTLLNLSFFNALRARYA